MPTPSITVRTLGSDGEPQFGQGQANFLTDADAVGQIIRTRLLLFQGEWWENRLDGTPWWQEVLGKGGAGRPGVIDLILQERILSVPFVTGLQNVNSGFNPSDRSFAYSAQALTAFGVTIPVNIPTPPDQRFPR